MPWQEIKGGAELLNLSGTLTNIATSFNSTTTPSGNWPTGVHPFVITVDRGNASEEKMLCSARSGSTFTVTTRGYDNTTAVSHGSSATIEHTANAVMLQEASSHINDPTRNDHTQYTQRSLYSAKGSILAATAGSTPANLAVGADATVLVADSTQGGGVKWATIVAGNIAAGAITAGKIAAGGVSASNQFAAGVVDSNALGAAAVIAGKVAVGGISASNQFAAGVVDSSALAAAAVIAGKIAAGGVSATNQIANAILTQALVSAGFRFTFEGTSAPGSPSQGDLWYDTTNKLLNVYNGSVWITITPVTALVATGESTASGSFGDLTTSGPAVTVLTGTKALVTIGGALENNTGNGGAAMAVAVSGATTLAATDANGAFSDATNATVRTQASYTFMLTGLTAGSNTFTAKYRSRTAGTATFTNRSITVVGIPT